MTEMARDKRVVVFGAGAAGKGLIGLLFTQAGYHVTFVDIKDDLVDRLRTAGRYHVLLHCLDGDRCEHIVGGFQILHASDRDAIAREIARAAFVLTAVFPQNLPDVARTVAQGIEQCYGTGRQVPLNCIACENMKNSSSTLKRHVAEHLNDDALPYSETHVGFPDCMINRVVPAPVDPLHVETEDYCEWTADANTLNGLPPTEIDFIEWVHNQDARLDRKLMVYNGTHAACAYFAFPRGRRWIHEAVADSGVAALVAGTLDELAAVVQHLHGFTEEAMADYKHDFWLRARNAGMKDTIVRIARQPIRKLGRHERLIAPAKLAQEYGMPREHILRAILAATRFRCADDPESVELSQRLSRDGLRQTLAAVSGLPLGDPLLDELTNVM